MSAMLAAQLILHPQLTKSLRLLATTVGRDKVRRRQPLWEMDPLTGPLDVPIDPISRATDRLVVTSIRRR